MSLTVALSPLAGLDLYLGDFKSKPFPLRLEKHNLSMPVHRLPRGNSHQHHPLAPPPTHAHFHQGVD